MAKADGFIPLDYLSKDEPAMVEAAQAFYQHMAKRRSVRDFSDQPIPRSVLENAILAAGSAPSGANMQPWHFAVVQDPVTKKVTFFWWHRNPLHAATQTPTP